MIKSAIQYFFWSNFLYGICATVICNYYQHLLGFQVPFSFLVLVFTGTIAFYSQTYLFTATYPSTSERTNWYFKNKKLLYVQQLIICATAIAAAVYSLIGPHSESHPLHNARLLGYFCSCLLLALLYYSPLKIGQNKFTIRQSGILKPLWIAANWTNLCLITPYLLFSNNPTLNIHVDFIIFYEIILITILCILFDYKDIEEDKQSCINTFFVRWNFKTIFWRCIVPLIIIGEFCLFNVFSYETNFTALAIHTITLCSTPLLALYIHKKQPPLIFYLCVVDGWMMLSPLLIAINNFYRSH